MKLRIEGNAVAVMILALLLPALARAQTPAATAPAQQVAASQTTAAPAKTAGTAPAGSERSSKEQLGRLPSAADLRPNGPVTIGANHAELVQGNSAVYVGNVTLDSDTLKMDGDRLELKRAADGQYTAKVTGAPAHMSHAGTGPDNPAMTAHAKTMTYDSRAGVVDLVGEALMTRGDDTTTAETIRYYVLDQRYEASGGDSPGGRVKIVLPQVNTPGAPAPAAAANDKQPAASAPPTPASRAAGAAPPAAPPATTQSGGGKP